jgi:hypothetical protein
MWRHSSPQTYIALLTGIVVVVLSVVPPPLTAARFINVALGAWLVVSGFAFRRTIAITSWSNAIVGILLALDAALSSAVGESVPDRQGRAARPDPKGDRVKITMHGKFLPYRKW